jgi:hypothetical protein
MPAGDRTGPMGQGPVTGRRLGYCAGYDSPGYTKGRGGGFGRGFGFGRGMGFGRRIGWGRGFGRSRGYGVPYMGYMQGSPWMPPMNKEEEIKLLKAEADSLKREQKDIEKRLADLEKEKE